MNKLLRYTEIYIVSNSQKICRDIKFYIIQVDIYISLKFDKLEKENKEYILYFERDILLHFF